jgi:MoxR-like ATPase
MIMTKTYSSDVDALNDLVVNYKKLRSEIGQVIIGQDEVVRDVLISIFSQGHCLLVGVPGLAKNAPGKYHFTCSRTKL